LSENISPNTTIAQYTIASKIGEGGMGEVWRARDPKLGRDVAIKVLPATLSADKDRLARFEQEAQAAGALNHPNILVIYHVGTHEGAPFIVSELLEGEELRDRLDDGTIPLRKAIEYAQQIVSGLSAAHDKGIVHRDLKPENLFITKDDRIKILDFGIAKLSASPASTSPDISEDATRKVLTNPGVVMGTVGYMSPEQVRGHSTDHRSDIFSFGAILHEMLTGRRTFKRETMAETMTAILREEPEELSVSLPNINQSLERIVRRCLEKKPERRFQSTHDLGFALDALSAPTSGSGAGMTMAATAAVAQVNASVWRARAPWIALAAVSLLALAALFLAFKNARSVPEVRTVRFSIIHGQRTTGFGQIAVSPDGRNVVINSINEGRGQLWLRPLDSLTSRALPNTEGSQGFSFWSPDSQSIAFAVGGKLKRFNLADGTVQPICDIPLGDRRGFAGTWNRDGTILFFVGTTIYRVSATNGSEPVPFPGLNQSSPEALTRWPEFLPDGNHFLYLVTNPRQSGSEIYVTSLDGKVTKRLLTAQSSAIYATSPTGSGHLLFARDGALLAQPFDAKTLSLTGQPVRVAAQVRVNSNSRGFFSTSDNGILVYDQFAEGEYRQLTWFDRAGKQLDMFGEKGTMNQLKLSPDQKRTALARRDPATGIFDLFVIEVARGATTRLTSGPADVTDPIWSPDSNNLAWVSVIGQSYKLMRKAASGTGQEEVLLESKTSIAPTGWSPDGKFILYTDNDPKTKRDIWVLPLEGDRKPFLFFQSPADDTLAVFSPDGHWVAYESSESGTREIYVQSFPVSGGKVPVSNKGGLRPSWRGDGKELFYVTVEGKLMAVETKAGSTFEPGVPKPLFDVAVARAIATANYDVSTDGQRFLFMSGQIDPNPSSLTVVLNWTADLKQ
jgi:eukaryotic-like serine/threonine-protein kinase